MFVVNICIALTVWNEMASLFLLVSSYVTTLHIQKAASIINSSHMFLLKNEIENSDYFDIEVLRIVNLFIEGIF
jgi:hypothetical protein